jgi:hypothetical protein
VVDVRNDRKVADIVDGLGRHPAQITPAPQCGKGSRSLWSTIPKSGYRFSEKILLHQRAKAPSGEVKPVRREDWVTN